MNRIKDRLIFQQQKMEVANPVACLLYLVVMVVCTHRNTTDDSPPPPSSLLNNCQAFEKRRDRKDQSAYAKEKREAVKKVRKLKHLLYTTMGVFLLPIALHSLPCWHCFGLGSLVLLPLQATVLFPALLIATPQSIQSYEL